MQSGSNRPMFLSKTALIAGVLLLAGTASAQKTPPAGGAKPAAGTPAKPAAKPADAKPAAAKPAAKPADTKAAAKPADTAAKPKPPTQKQKDAAKAAFKGAEEKFGKGDYAGALELYKEAEANLPGDRPKYMIALSIDKMGKVVEAVASYQAFLDAKPNEEKMKDQIAEANNRLKALKETPAKVKLALTPEAPAGLKVKVDDADAQLGAGNELALAPGKHKLTIDAEGFETATQEVEVRFAEAKDMPVALTKKPEPPPPEPVASAPPPPPPATTAAAPPPPPPQPRSKIPAYVTLGFAGVGAVVGTIFGIQALSGKSEFNSNPTTEKADEVDRNALIADMSYAVAITFGVTGAVLLFSKETPEEPKAAKVQPKRRAFVAPYVTPTGGGAAARMTF